MAENLILEDVQILAQEMIAEANQHPINLSGILNVGSIKYPDSLKREYRKIKIQFSLEILSETHKMQHLTVYSNEESIKKQFREAFFGNDPKLFEFSKRKEKNVIHFGRIYNK